MLPTKTTNKCTKSKVCESFESRLLCCGLTCHLADTESFLAKLQSWLVVNLACSIIFIYIEHFKSQDVLLSNVHEQLKKKKKKQAQKQK